MHSARLHSRPRTERMICEFGFATSRPGVSPSLPVIVIRDRGNSSGSRRRFLPELIRVPSMSGSAGFQPIHVEPWTPDCLVFLCFRNRSERVGLFGTSVPFAVVLGARFFLWESSAPSARRNRRLIRGEIRGGLLAPACWAAKRRAPLPETSAR